jgi:hypothetical protein
MKAGKAIDVVCGGILVAVGLILLALSAELFALANSCVATSGCSIAGFDTSSVLRALAFGVFATVAGVVLLILGLRKERGSLTPVGGIGACGECGRSYRVGQVRFCAGCGSDLG